MAAPSLLFLLLGLMAGCQGDVRYEPEQQETKPGTAPQSPDPEEEADVLNFSWVQAEQLAGMAQPGLARSLDEDLAFLQGQGLRLLVSLTEEPTSEKELKAHGMELLHLPVADFTPPGLGQMNQFARRNEASLAQGRPVGVHCTAGMGRTGTMLASWFVWQGMEGVEAIQEIRRLRPGSIETPEQEAAVLAFSRSLRGGER